MCRSDKSGKLRFIKGLLPARANNNDDDDYIPRPPAPRDSDKKRSPPPPYNHASMAYHPPMGMGVSANHMPMSSSASGAKPSHDGEGFNVWCIKGYSGYVKFPKNNDPSETYGRLETMNQVMHNRHGYDPSKLPRPPTPSKEDKRKAHYDSDDEDEYIPRPPTPDKELKCVMCKVTRKHKKHNETKKIKRFAYRPLCWYCVRENYEAEAILVWEEE